MGFSSFVSDSIVAVPLDLATLFCFWVGKYMLCVIPFLSLVSYVFTRAVLNSLYVGGKVMIQIFRGWGTSLNCLVKIGSISF